MWFCWFIFNNKKSKKNEERINNIPKIHPCTKNYDDIAEEDKDEDYSELIFCVQCHRKHTKYCLKPKKGTKKQKCRFNYPKPITKKTKVIVIEVVNKETKKIVRYKVKVISERNDEILNGHNREKTNLSR